MNPILTQILLYVFLFFMLVLSALFSGSEIAFATSNKVRLELEAENGNKKAAFALRIINNFSSTISTILVGNNLVNIAASSVMTVLFTSIYKLSNGTLIASVITTVALLIFGEIFPKIISTEYADKLSIRYAPFIRIFQILFFPIVKLVEIITHKAEHLWTPDEEEIHNTDDLVTMLETIEEEGVVDEKDAELIKSAIEFPDIEAREILIPRVDVAAYDASDGYSAIFDSEELLSYSRFPVYNESLDNILGIITTKKLLKESISNPDLDVSTLLTPPLYVHMTKNVSDILSEFRKTHTYMAIVIDEFGGMMGIITIEDILEEIFGEIYDETDEPEDEPVPIIDENANVIEIDAGMNVYDAFELLNFSDDEFHSEYTTVGGWATEVLDKFPVPGDSFRYKNLTVTVLEAEALRVLTVKIELDPLTEEEDDSED